MLSEEVIKAATTERASPIIFASKKDDSLRFCVDYRKFNAVTVRDSYPLQRMDDCIDSLGDTTKVSSLDANFGYWQIEIDEKNKKKWPSQFTTGSASLSGCNSV